MTSVAKRRCRVLRECDHCDGIGEVPVHCVDCGDELFTDTAAMHKRENDDDDLCLTCDKTRAEDRSLETESNGEPK